MEPQVNEFLYFFGQKTEKITKYLSKILISSVHFFLIRISETNNFKSLILTRYETRDKFYF